jgi:catechol-2,3-dioxygenase
MISTPSIGHVVLNVRDLALSVPFYCQTLGLKEVGRNARPMVFLSFGFRDHDLALRQADDAARGHDRSAVGLRHVAFRIGQNLDELQAFRMHLDARGVPIKRVEEHIASTSIYLSDPDGIELEAYIEHPEETWRGRQAGKINQ